MIARPPRFAPLLIGVCLAGMGTAVAQADDPQTGPSAPRQPNIIFIMADDLGKGLLPLYDASVEIATPNIERLAGEGVIFDNAYATPICLPTRTQLISGRYPVNNGIVGHSNDHINIFLDPQRLPSFANPLWRAGYATAVAGKWHGMRDYQNPRVLRAFGFDEWMLIGHQEFTSAATSDGRVDFDGDFPADRLADFVVDFIGEHRDQPFFVYYPMALVHRPFVPTPDRPDADSDVEKLIAMTEYADKMVGRVLDALEASGVRDDTVVFFSGDNGLALSWPTGASLPWEENGVLIRGKNMLTEAGVNVPLIVGGGPVARRGRTDALTDFTDMFPTLAALAGASLSPEEAPDGQSFADFLLGRTEDTPRQWIASAAAARSFTDPIRFGRECGGECPTPFAIGSEDGYYWKEEVVGLVVRDRRFKLWHHGDGFRGLFDLQEDPYETVNLWESKDPEVVAAREQLLEAFSTLPVGDVVVRARQFGDDHGLQSHWRFDHPRANADGSLTFVDAANGYHARISEPLPLVSGKFGAAIESESVRAERFGEFISDRPEELARFTLSAWVRLENGWNSEANVLRLRPNPGTRTGLIELVVTRDGALAGRHWIEEITTAPGALSHGDWTHVAMVWGPRRTERGAALYINGALQARFTGFMADPINRSVAPPDAALEIGGAGVALDDVAIWGQALPTEQVRAIHFLGADHGYDAGEVEALFNAPFWSEADVGRREWHRRWPSAEDFRLAGEPTPEGTIEFPLGDGTLIRSLPSAAPE